MKIAKTGFEIKYLWSDYLKSVKDFFQDTHTNMVKDNNHDRHDKDVNYIENMILPISEFSSFWRGKTALDFGCGCGRNIRNLLNAADFERVDGCDVSKNNAEYAKKYVEEYFNFEKDQKKCNTWETNGYDLQPASNEEYDYVMSHIVFQHIPNYSIRYNILKDIYRVLKKGGIANIHFMDLDDSVGYYDEHPSSANYDVCYTTYEKIKSNNSDLPNVNKQQYNTALNMRIESRGFDYHMWNCRVENVQFLIEDFKKIGFIDVEYNKCADPYSKKDSFYIRGRKKI